MTGPDPFGTEALRARVLAGWRASSARFREDANAEEDAARGGYRDRLVVELAQNAADAARAGGVPGRLLLRLEGDRLIAANTGATLSAAGVEALSTLRASAKRDGQSTGRFGVGFAAVVAVSDDPAIGSAGARSVCWSRRRTLGLLAGEPSLSAELERRGDHVPLLRLPFDGEPLPVPGGYDTVVVLPLLDPAAAAALLDELDPTLPLLLPGLTEIVVQAGGAERTLRCEQRGDRLFLAGVEWALAEASGPLPAELADERSAEDRAEPRWWVRALARVDGGPLPAGAAQVLRAPTPTDEPLSMPLILAASVPLEPTRRRVLRGPLADHVLAATGQVLAELAGRVDDPLRLVPTGLAAGDVDLAIREALLGALPAAPVLAGMRGRDCLALDLGPAGPAVAALLGSEVAGLLERPWSAPMAALGVRRLDTGDVVGLLAGLGRPPQWWQLAYAALADAPDLDALAAIPVPLADGRVVTGARGALLPAGELPDLAALPIRLIDPRAAHPLLLRLGAQPATAASLLGDPAVREAVEGSLDDPDLELARAICALVAVAGAEAAAANPWLERLALPARGGGWAPAGDLLWPGGLMDRVVAPDGPFDRLDPPPWLQRSTALALGVLDGPALLRAQDVPVDPELHDPDPDQPGVLDLDGAADWLATLDGPELPVVLALRDLETVGDLPALVRAIAAEPDLRSAVLARPSYSAWWLGQRPVLDGLLPAECALGAEPLLAGLFAPAPDLDPEFLTALGVWPDLASILADPEATGDLLDRLGDRDRVVSRSQLAGLHQAIGQAWADRLDQAPDPPLTVRAVLASGELAVLPATDAVVVDTPDLLPLVLARGLGVPPVPLRLAPVLADLLDAALSSELDLPAPVGGEPTAIPPVLAGRLAAPISWVRHQQLTVDGVALQWRWADGVLHATDSGLAAGLAWAAGDWSSRHLFAALLARPADVVMLELEADF